MSEEPAAERPVSRRSLLGLIVQAGTGVHLQRMGRSLAHAGLVGLAAGLLGSLFLAGLELTQRLLLEHLAGVHLLRAAGERLLPDSAGADFRPWLLLLVPAAGALLAGILMRLAPETRGGGGDAMIRGFHHGSTTPPGRVAWVKGVASILTLGSGGSGGREGPTMQMGGALGTLTGRALGLSVSERRTLLVAGVAAGMAAVFRTPLGAALLAIEVLYHDDFEAEALVPALLASVISYAVVVTLYGESTLFALPGRWTFRLGELPLFALLAVLVAALAAGFQATLAGVRRASARLRLPEWARPAVGGLLTGVVALTLILAASARTGQPGHALGILGGGYGAAQLALTGGELLPGGWAGVGLLLVLCAAKLLASGFTIGTGGSAGDFAPSLVLGALLGGAFGRAAQLVTGDPSLSPGAFALVGMGTFYGGIAHVPVAALVMTCELAGSYDLLVPLMLAGGVAFLALRRRSLYEDQVPTRAESPVHRAERGLGLLAGRRVRDALQAGAWLSVSPTTTCTEILRRIPEAVGQHTVPVLDADQRLVGVISPDVVRHLAANREAAAVTIAAELLASATTVGLDDELATAAAIMLARGLQEVPVVEGNGRFVALLADADVFRTWMELAGGPEDDGAPP
jgi:CIC family chloride channel protein